MEAHRVARHTRPRSDTHAGARFDRFVDRAERHSPRHIARAPIQKQQQFDQCFPSHRRRTALPVNSWRLSSRHLLNRRDLRVKRLRCQALA